MPVGEWVGALAVVILSLFIFSYLLADDNAFFRMGAHLLVGISAGFFLALLVKSVLIDQYLIASFQKPDWILIVLIVLFGILLLARALPGSPVAGNLPMAYLVGVGSAVVIGGAISGTLVPQVMAAAMPGLVPGPMPADSNAMGPWVSNIVELVLVLVATILTLAYFSFGARPRGGATPEPPRVMKPFIWIGRAMLTITLGVLYAGALLSTLTALTGWWFSAVQALVNLLQGPAS
jgi:hypothetical protein